MGSPVRSFRLRIAEGRDEFHDRFGAALPPAVSERSALLDHRWRPASEASPVEGHSGAGPVGGAAPAAASPYDQASGTYKIALDPEYQQIQTEARANLQRLETEPAYQAEIQQRINALQAKIKANFGTRVVIQ